jgi:1-acyl-sn-glycerol-3-phosphate acyltransferase
MSNHAAFPQDRMEPLYGICHYALRVAHRAFFRGETVGLEHLPPSGAFLVAANHASHLDPPFIGAALPRQMAFFARKSLWKPGLGAWWMDAVRAIPVDRDGADLRAIKRVLGALAEGRPIALFPEGTRSPDGALQEAKPGVGMIVCKTRVPVVPCRIFGSFEAFGRGGGLKLGTPVSIVFGPAMRAEEYDRPEDGKERYQQASERIMAAVARLAPPPEQVV